MERILQQGLETWGLPTDAIPRLQEFSRLLLEKNRVMNLTAITDPADVARLHFLDCASLLTIADFPGKKRRGRRHRRRFSRYAPAAAGAGL